MSQLEELKRQRKELDAKIKELENTEIVCGKAKYDGKAVSINFTKYYSLRAESVQWRKALLFVNDENVKEHLLSLINDLQSLYDKIR